MLILLVALLCGALAFAPEEHAFQAETSKLMDIIINSLYTNKEIFLRELLSNAADALEKARFFSLTEPGILGEGEEAALEIRVWYDEDLRELYIQDSGIGMDKDELVRNLGTIAESGTRRFLESMLDSASPEDSGNLIGQFGVGFFSAFLVADEVTFDTVRTPRGPDEARGECVRWASNAVDSFTIAPSPATDLARGSRVTLHMKQDSLEFLDADRIRALIDEYSGYLPFPIYFQTFALEEVEAEPAPAGEGESEGEDVEDVEDAPQPETVMVARWEHVNDKPVIWVRDPSELSDQDYKDFFRNGLSRKSHTDPTAWVHFKGEGDVSFRALIYLPKSAPFIYMNDHDRARESMIRLYISRVFVTDEIPDIVPSWLSFLSGVIDSESIQINLSREMLQHSRALGVIGRRITRKVLELLADMAFDERADAEAYEAALAEWRAATAALGDDEEPAEEPAAPELRFSEFYSGYSDYLKAGVLEDERNRDKIAALLRFPTSRTIAENPDAARDIRTSKFGILKKETAATFAALDEYIERMPEWQHAIYTIGGANLDEVESSPLIEQAVARGIEVLYLISPIDSFVFNAVTEFRGVKVESLMREGVELPRPDGEGDDEDDGEDLGHLAEMVAFFFRISLSDKLEKVVPSTRLANSPALIVSAEGGPSSIEERIIEAQAMAESRFFMRSKRVMEINMRHPIIRGMARTLERLNPELDTGNVPYGTERLRKLARLVYETACIQSGYAPESMRLYTSGLYELLEDSIENDWLRPSTEDVLRAGKHHERFQEMTRPVEDEDEDEVAAEEDELLAGAFEDVMQPTPGEATRTDL
eukprot:gnl/Chilomastix_cuspidata/555.p1 GENE.gnl/Chilomastix_cuspidata/555~~gnl/Chilomastix_cuspidata/555.p1  ORF type:complete len:823 (-),score=476.16 gnl/Chilomastix_cuspidata/555:573-3041(-)